MTLTLAPAPVEILDPNLDASMKTSLEAAPAVALPSPLPSSIDDACSRIPPLWPLKNFVAVNPFLGLCDRPFVEAASLVRRVAHGDILMPPSYYSELWQQGRITEADLKYAIEQARRTLPEAAPITPDSLVEAVQRASSTWGAQKSLQVLEGEAIGTVADVLDTLRGTQWVTFVVDEISKWCSAYYDEGQASWRMPWRGQPLFEAWREAAVRDVNPEVMGLRAFRGLVASLPSDEGEAIEHALSELGVPSEGASDFLHRELMSIAGWSGYARFQAWQKELYGESDGSLRGLLAIRLAYEVALHRQHEDTGFRQAWANNMEALSAPTHSPAILPAYVWQLAAEHAFGRGLLGDIASANASASAVAEASGATRPSVQAVFCIDVRSEVMRRSLESVSPQIETIGFAGFFGFAIESVPFGQAHGSAQCPVLLTPRFRIREALPGASREQEAQALEQQAFSKRLGRSWNSFKTSAVSCFSFVETGGLLSGAKLLKDSLGQHAPHDEPFFAPRTECEHEHETGMSLDEQIATAAGALKNMGLTSNLARLVVICGHGSQTANNPYGSGLDCGACGGYSGEANARVAATVLNNSAVREGLAAQGIAIPSDTHFVAALHNTTTDDVTLFDTALIPETHHADLKYLQDALAEAARRTRAQRAPSLGLEGVSAELLDEAVRARSTDWAQVRPEWGLAGNAAFIAAPRERTKSLNLGGRAFLHNYNWKGDTDGSILELIMTAPMVVASWISLQYFGLNGEQRIVWQRQQDDAQRGRDDRRVGRQRGRPARGPSVAVGSRRAEVDARASAPLRAHRSAARGHLEGDPIAPERARPARQRLATTHRHRERGRALRPLL
jgi:uncharacterized protein YbcC (UPF0753/DUF2309 family)